MPDLLTIREKSQWCTGIPALCGAHGSLGAKGCEVSVNDSVLVDGGRKWLILILLVIYIYLDLDLDDDDDDDEDDADGDVDVDVDMKVNWKDYPIYYGK